MKLKLIYILFILFIISCKNETNSKINSDTSNIEKYYLIDIDADVDANDYVLAPSRKNFDSAFAKGLESTIFVFYPRKVVAKMQDSVVLYEIGDTIKLPNSLVIPLKKQQKATKGNIVLTWWQSGTGMQRAIVLNRDSSTTPTVYYLDNQYSFYSSVTDVKFWIDTLAPNSFTLLTQDTMSGRSMSVSKEYYTTFYTIINCTKNKVLALSWAGTLELFDKSQCNLVPLYQEFNVGDSVSVPYLGTYSEGTVLSVWNDIGKITVKINFLDEKIETYANMIDTYIVERD